MHTHTCHDIADYFLSLVKEDEGDLVSNLKLQKLVYYAQGFSLAMNDKPLFEEPIEAWQHGPVCVELYHRFKDYGGGAIPPVQVDLSEYDDDTQELLNEVNRIFGQFSAWKLRNLTHEEPTWLNAYEKPDDTITQKAMKDYFKTQLTEEE
ncbi:MAG: DUF4065 domain-containing protein [Candidatus Sedimenticola sp. (ex Thyasira tokunagai)]